MGDLNLGTTNILLGIMAAVSVLQAFGLIAAAIMGIRMYRTVMRMVRDIQERQIAPLAARVDTLLATVDGVLADVKSVTGRVSHGTERVESAIDDTMHRVDKTSGRVRASVASRIGHIAALINGVWSLVGSLRNGRRMPHVTPG